MERYLYLYFNYGGHNVVLRYDRINDLYTAHSVVNPQVSSTKDHPFQALNRLMVRMGGDSRGDKERREAKIVENAKVRTFQRQAKAVKLTYGEVT